MLQNAFIILGLTSFFFIFYGYFSKAKFMELSGFLIVFLLGIVLLTSYIEIPTGSEKYNCNYYINQTLEKVRVLVANYTETTTDFKYTYLCTAGNSTSTNIETETYTQYSNHTIGFYLCALGLLGWVMVFLKWRD